jgi:hypothetical protein
VQGWVQGKNNQEQNKKIKNALVNSKKKWIVMNPI